MSIPVYIAVISFLFIMAYIAVKITYITSYLEKIDSSLLALSLQKLMDSELDVCPKCHHHKIGHYAKFCHKCGESLAMTCNSCTSIIPSYSNFCPVCRKDYKTQERETSENE